MLRDTPSTIYLKDYRAPDYLIDSVALDFDLGADATVVKSRLSVRANHDHARDAQPLILHGQDLELLSVAINGEELAGDCYHYDADTLTIETVPAAFTLDIATRIYPQRNTSLEGLYVSRGMFCTQCEAEGFRKITYYLDRPDVMARFSTTITADRDACPVLLSNGNLVGSGESADGRHWVRWEDPFPKPSYLFALVAGKLDLLEDRYVTRSGREVALRLYVEPGHLDKCRHAMDSLKRAMRWDEETFGLEYDLDIYMIVAVDDFNMGAMENKGLNIFNTAYVLAKPETATDADYDNIEGVIGHEYFHNWTGNRVTCRDWFQLSLKEGLTVFRDQEFSADMGSRAVKRIHDVRMLRGRQFPEDAGPMAHSVRPNSYVEVNNFYTATVYEKGAEVVRMIHTLVGRDGFRRGLELYFQRHDGQAVTTDDFVQAMADANGMDLGRFRRWYDQAGTPELKARGVYDADAGRYTLTLTQSTPPTPGQEVKQPLYIPVRIGLLGANDGAELPLRLADEPAPAGGTSRLIVLAEREQQFTFVDVAQPVVPSLLRGFSAPVKLDAGLSDDELVFLLGHDPDEFNRWEAGQQLAVRLMLKLIAERRQGRAAGLDHGFIEAMRRTLTDEHLDKALIAEAWVLPSETYIAELSEVVDPTAIHEVRHFMRLELARALTPELWDVYRSNRDKGGYRYSAEAAGRRRLKNLVLSYLTELGEREVIATCDEQFSTADNMTDGIAALAALANTDCPERTAALKRFYDTWRDQALVVNKWLSIQATSRLPGTVDEVQRLLRHKAFDEKNPNKVRALIGAFAHGNPLHFHDLHGAGYRLVADQVLRLDPLNPQVAARLVSAFNRWRRYDAARQQLMRTELERIEQAPRLSRDVYEIVSKALR